MKRSYAVAALAAACFCLPAAAQFTPPRAVKVIVPYTAGGPSDVVTRVVATQMGKTMNVPVVVENRPGATGTIGMSAAARAPADGSTMVMFSLGGSVLNAVLRDKLPYDLLKDFTPVGNMVDMAQLLVVNPELPVKSVNDLIAYGKAHPNKLSYGSSGVGASTHLIGELFQQVTGVKMVHVPYQGTGPATTDTISGQIQLLFTEVPVLIQPVQAGKLRALALGNPQRSPLMPEVPTMAEVGLPQLEAYNWFGLQAPAKTPPEAIAYLNEHLVKALNDPQTRATLQAMGADPAPGTPDDFGRLVRREMDKWREVARKADIRVEQ
ncbi:tripartite tricarboxylate transporter substrate binding protein BugE [Pigmentiphaga soli]|uniref:Tripartite tricarboxylate transporter substrate binding protein BugE n=1 Tax=Pigmentiphaga soli TaxID=1007095 RepID=A0ABP8GUX0_9BURK